MKNTALIWLFFVLFATNAFGLSIITTLEPNYGDYIPIYENIDKYPEIARLDKNATIEIIGRDDINYFYKVKTADNKIGYIEEFAIESHNEKELSEKLTLALSEDNKDKLTKINLSSKNCPIRILDVYLTENSIGIPEVNIKYQNKGLKTIKAFSVEIYPYNTYGERLSSFGKNVYRGLSDDENLKQGAINKSVWVLNLFDTTKSVKVKIYRILFSDGSKWGNK